MMKKSYIGMVAAVLLAGGVLAGCGDKETGTTQRAAVSGQTMEDSVKQTAPMQVPSTAQAETQPVQTSAPAEEAAATQPPAETTEAAAQAAPQAAAPGETTLALTDSGISPDAAKDVALEDAGVSEAEVSGMRVRREYEDGVDVYKVEFYVQNKEYDYEIAAYYGEILSFDYDIDNDYYYPGAQQTAPTGGQQGTISMEEAMNLVLAKVPGATAENIRIKMDWDDGRQLYEGDVYYDKKEYEFEMDASTGNFLEWSEESIYY